MTQGVSDDQLGRRHRRVHGAQPTPKTQPDLGGEIDGQMLQQALSNATELNIDMVGAQFAAHGSTIRLCGPMQILITAATAQRLHGGHPEVVGIRTQDMNGLTLASIEMLAIDGHTIQTLQDPLVSADVDFAYVTMP